MIALWVIGSSFRFTAGQTISGVFASCRLTVNVAFDHPHRLLESSRAAPYPAPSASAPETVISWSLFQNRRRRGTRRPCIGVAVQQSGCRYIACGVEPGQPQRALGRDLICWSPALPAKDDKVGAAVAIKLLFGQDRGVGAVEAQDIGAGTSQSRLAFHHFAVTSLQDAAPRDRSVRAGSSLDTPYGAAAATHARIRDVDDPARGVAGCAARHGCR